MHSKLQLPPEADTYLVNSCALMKPEISGTFSQNRVTGFQSKLIFISHSFRHVIQHYVDM